MNSIRLILSLMVASLLETRGAERKSMDVTVKVVDEEGRPVPGAFIVGGSEGDDTCVSKKVDKEGMALFKDATKRKTFEPQILAPGYYKSEGCFVTMVQLPGTDRDYVVTLRKVINPVKIQSQVSEYLIGRVIDKDMGFDLEKMDWTPPHGAGIHTDLVVRAKCQPIDDMRDEQHRLKAGFRSIVTLSTVGIGNGFFPFEAERVSGITKPGSIFMPPYQVPLTGLTNQISFVTREYDEGGGNYSESEKKHYAFRVRTECNETNGIIKAHVGWMEGPIMAGVTYTPEQYKTKVFPKPSELIPDRFCLKFVRHWNPDPTSNSLEPNNPKIRWENEISQLIRRYKLQDMPWVKEWQPLDRNDPQWIPSPEEVRAERKAEEADRLRQRQEINRANQEKYFRDHPERAAQYYKDHPEERIAPFPQIHE
ncbi:MAG: hypothetical protein U1F87_11860 [Kiritimatiellia bacterium]